MWTVVSESPKITSLDELDLGKIRGAQGGGYDAPGYNPEMTLDSTNAYKLEDKDVWSVKEESADTDVAQHRHTGDELDDPGGMW